MRAVIMAICCLFVASIGVLAKAAAPELTVISALPNGEVSNLHQITVRFSEAMHPLGDMEQKAETAPLRLEAQGAPLPAGTFRWLDTETLAYQFENPVSIPLRINVTVPENTSSLQGLQLRKAVQWSLNTPYPAISHSLSPNREFLAPNGNTIHLFSNYPLNLDDLKAKTRLVLENVSLPLSIVPFGYINRYGIQVAETALSEHLDSVNLRDRKWQYTIQWQQSLLPGTQLVLVLEKGVRPVQGGLPFPGLKVDIPTYKPLVVKEMRLESGQAQKKGHMPEAPLFLEFSNPVSLENLRKHLVISPPVELQEDTWQTRHNNPDTPLTNHNLSFAFKPATQYTVSITEGLTDSYGTRLAKTFKQKFTTLDLQPLHSLPDGYYLLERSLGGVVPFFVQNISPIALHARFLPWNFGIGKVLGDNLEKPLITALGTVRDSEIQLDFSAQYNTMHRETWNLPQLFSGVHGGGLFTIQSTWTDRNTWNKKTNTLSRLFQAQISDLSIGSKIGRDNGLVWLTSLSSGKAVAGAAISLHGPKGRFWQGVTDASGFVSLPGSKSFPDTKTKIWILAQHNDDSVMAQAFAPAMPSPYADFTGVSPERTVWKVHVLAQLPLYQPGQTVRYSVYAREFTSVATGATGDDAGSWQSLPGGETLTLVFSDAGGKELCRTEGPLSAFGSLSGECHLPAEARLGTYYVQATRKNNVLAQQARAFSVASFRPPDFKVDITPPKDQAQTLPGDEPLETQVSAAYFSGASLEGAKVNLLVQQRNTRFIPPRLSGYTVGLGGMQPFMRYSHRDFSEQVTLAAMNAVLDDAGKARFAIPPQTVQAGKPSTISLEATVKDATGLVSQGAASFLMHPSDYYLGVKGPFMAFSGQDVPLEFKAATFEDAAVKNTTVSLKAEKADTKGNFTELAWEKSFLLEKAEGQIFNVQFAQSGSYRLQATVRDEQGRANTSELYILVPGAQFVWNGLDGGHSLELIADKASYAPGDTVRIVAKNPLAEEENTALVTVEREGVRSFHTLQLTGQAPVIEVPVSTADAPYVFVSVLLGRGRVAPPPDGVKTFGADTGAPKVFYGVLVVPIDTPEALKVRVNTDKENYKPGESVQASVQVHTVQGAPANAEITLLAVDNRIFRAAGEKTAYNPQTTFGPLFSHSVRTADMRTLLFDLGISEYFARLREQDLATAAGLMKAEMPLPSSPMEAKPSQDSDAPGNSLRENFAPDVFWLSGGTTNSQGQLSASFTLPDTLTSYRIVAIAADKTRLFATAETNITASKPLQLVSALPRFVTQGDQLEARVLVQNLGKHSGKVLVNATAEGFTLHGESSKAVDLSAGGSQRVSFMLTADAGDTATLRLKAQMQTPEGTEEDAALFTLPVLPTGFLHTVAAAGVLGKDTSFSLPVRLPAALDPRSRMDVIFAASPAAGLPLTAQGLLDYPWDCLEQSLSRGMVRVLRLEHGDLLGLPADPQDRSLLEKLRARIPAFQKPDGGFALWPELGWSDMYLTAYVLFADSRLQALQLGLDADTRNKAADYLTAQLQNKQRVEGAEIRAWALWQLAQLPKHKKNARKLLPDIRSQVLAQTEPSPFSLVSLMLASHSLQEDTQVLDKALQPVLKQLEKTAVISPTQMHFASRSPFFWASMGSTLRDNGFILMALCQIKPDYPRLEALAQWLSQGLGERQVLSTQESIFGLLGLSAYLQTLETAQPTRLQAEWNAEIVTKEFNRLIDPPQTWRLAAQSLPEGGTDTLTLKTLSGKAYWTVRLQYAATAIADTAENAGMTLTRTWSKKSPWFMGEEVTVQLTLTVPATRRHVLIYDPFPAGLEPSYASRADLQLLGSAHKFPYPWQRNELRENGLLLYAAQINPGTYTYKYTLRAAVPGTFIQRPSFAEEMYTPEVYGRTGGEIVEVLPE